MLPDWRLPVDAFLVSLVTVGIAEVGDRSLFLALLFGLRYQRPWPIFIGMAVGLFANQALSAVVGLWLFQWLSDDWHNWIIAGAFLFMAIWVLLPEQNDEEIKPSISSPQLIWAAAISFFLLEIADKSQLVVITLAGSYQSVWPVVFGATLGILATTAPVLWLGYKFAHKIPVHALKWVASGLFFALALGAALSAAGWATLPNLF